jgi:hypothetical protein
MATSVQSELLAGKALDYLIGADGEQRGKEGRVTETPFGVKPAPLGISIAYCNLRCEDGEPPKYGPYLPHDDIFEQYGEGRPNPEAAGFERNIVAQLDRCKKLGHALVEEDNPDSYSLSAVMLGINRAQDRGLGVIAKNPHLMKDGALTYIGHPNIFGIIVEKDCGTPGEMDALRRKALKPELPVWFVSYGDGHEWANQTANEISARGYRNMSVTYSSAGEYEDSQDVLLPIPARTVEATTTGRIGVSVMDTNQAQTILTNIGLLDPPPDGVLGPVTKWALEEFCKRANVPFDGSTITDSIGQALTSARPLPLTPGDDLAGRIVSAMIAKGHWVARHSDCLNIVYVEGMNADGSPNGNAPNQFNDRRMVIRIGGDGVPKIEGSWEGTTEPGRQYTEHPLNRRGAARVAFGQHKAWSTGDYHGWESLLQAAPISVYRDLAENYRREGAADVGEFGIHQHRGYDLPKNDIGPSSAGCLIGRTNNGHREFMALVKTDARYLANPNYKFMTTILPVDALVGITIRSPSLVPASEPAALVASLTQDTIDRIAKMAGDSDLARYEWIERGVAPRGYIKGMAVTFGRVYSKWRAGDSAARVMAVANSGDESTDALAWYDSEFRGAGMNNASAGAATLRHLFVLLTGLGMRESSGRYCEGRDRSANNATADTAETGLFQMSWNASSASPELPKLFRAYSANPEGFLSIFQEGVRSTESDLTNYGSGEGAEFQRLCKSCPAFAVEAAALGLRTIRKHWGPINRHEAEVRPECNKLLQQVQDVIDGLAVSQAVPKPQPVETPMTDRPAQQQIDLAALAAQVQALGANVRSMQIALDQLKAVIPAGPPPVALPMPAPLPTSTSAPQIDVGAALAQILHSLRPLVPLIQGIPPQPQPTPVSTPLPNLTPSPTSPAAAPTIDTARIIQDMTRIGQLAGRVGQLSSVPSGTLPSGTGAMLSPIDKALGGEAMVGLKTPLAILAYAAMWIMQAFGTVGTATGDKATTTGQVLTALIAAFGGMGLTAKFDRALKAMNAVAAATQKLPASSGSSNQDVH